MKCEVWLGKSDIPLVCFDFAMELHKDYYQYQSVDKSNWNEIIIKKHPFIVFTNES